MQRHLLSLAVVFLGYLVIAPNLNAENAADYVNRGNAWDDKGEYDKAIADYTEAIRLDPKCVPAYGNRGIAWVKKGEPDKAIADSTEAIRLDPKCVPAYGNRGIAWVKKGEPDKAIADYNEAIRLDPKFAPAYLSRGLAWVRKGEYDKAIADYSEAISINPKDANAYIKRGYAWGCKRKFDKVIADFNEAISINPKDVFAYFCRGKAWANKGEYDKAIADYTEAIRLDPKCVPAYENRGIAWGKKGEYDEANADLNQALSINPKDATACNGLAWMQATCPDEKYRDGKKAVENANKVNQLTEGKVCAFMDTRAAAYAESGDFEKAKEWAAKAIDMATTDKSISEKDKARLVSHLELFKQGKPYRDVPTNVEREGRASEDTRTWTAANGKFTVKATFVSSDTTEVKLKKEGGKTITVALDRLSDEDQAWVQKRLKQ